MSSSELYKEMYHIRLISFRNGLVPNCLELEIQKNMHYFEPYILYTLNLQRVKGKFKEQGIDRFILFCPFSLVQNNKRLSLQLQIKV